MGGRCSRQKPYRFLIQGLDAAGKTTLLYRLKLGEIVTTIPTIGFNVETVRSANGMEFDAWDVGGRDKIRPLYRHYYPNTDGLIYVVDSSDRERLGDALEELDNYILKCEELSNIVLMILANKQDLKAVMSPAEIEDELQKQCQIGFGITVFVMPCSVTDVNDSSMYDAFEKFATIVTEKKQGKHFPGLISRAWEEKTKKEEAMDKELNAGDGFAHELKMTWMKNPIHMLKSILFY